MSVITTIKVKHCVNGDTVNNGQNGWYTHFYQPQWSWAKVMFLQVSVILSTWGGGVSASGADPRGADTPLRTRHPPGPHPLWSKHPLETDTPPEQTPPRSRHTPPDQTPPRTKCTPWPPGSRLWHTVNKRLVRILLECILVSPLFWWQ